MNRNNYPPNWREISQAEREAAGNKCRQCGVPNHHYVSRYNGDKTQWIAITKDQVRYTDYEPGWTEFVQVVLTVGHVDQNPQNNHPDNLRAWCQRCHLNHDRPWNIEKMKRKRAIAGGQLAMNI